MSAKETLIILILTLLIISFTNITKAKSLYVIADTGTCQTDTPIIQAYDIQDSNLILQTQYECVHPLAIGIAMDTDSEISFDKISFSGIIRYNKVGAFRKISNSILRR